MRVIGRRQLVRTGVGLAGLAMLAGCGVGYPRTQQSVVHRIAYLSTSGLSEGIAAAWSAFRDALRDLGYVEGQNLVVEERHGLGDEFLKEPASELIRLQTEVIVVPSITVARAVQAVSNTVPIVSGGAGDLVAGGAATSLARPGGNVTGLSTPPLDGRQLQLLREAVPTLARVAVLFDTTQPSFPRARSEAAASDLHLEAVFVGASGTGDLDAAFESAVRERSDGLLANNSPLVSANQSRIGELAIQHRLPTIFQQSEAADRGGLMAYSPNRVDLYRRAAVYVDKILRGAKPADLPVEQPSKFDFAINLRTAQALGLTIPRSVLQQATEIIQ